MTASLLPTVVLAAGGTGGHVFPAEALARELLGRCIRPLLFTDRRGRGFGQDLEEVPVTRITAGGVAGRGLLARLGASAELALGSVQALRHLRRIRPACVVGFGGYAALPTMLAACFSGMRTMIHEQNAILGRANRMLAGRVARIAVVFETVGRVPPEAQPRVVLTGMPVRSVFAETRASVYVPPQAGDVVELLVIGGSQGAKVFSDVVPEALVALPDGVRARLRVSQQCRPETLDAVTRRYAEAGIKATLAPFFSDIPQRLERAHLVIARAGASTVGEVTMAGRPAVLVPYPFAADDHQRANAAAVAAAGAGWLLDQASLTPDQLALHLTQLLDQPAALAETAARAQALGCPDAAARLADQVVELLQESRS